MLPTDQVKAQLLDHGRKMLVDSDHVLAIAHALMPEGQPALIVGVPDMERRHMAIEYLWKEGAEAICLMYDGYITKPPGPRTGALVVYTFVKGQPPQIAAQSYKKVEDGSYLFEPVEDFPADGLAVHGYPTHETRH